MMYTVCFPVYTDAPYGCKLSWRKGASFEATDDEDAIKIAKNKGVENPVLELQGHRKQYGNHYERNARE